MLQTKCFKCALPLVRWRVGPKSGLNACREHVKELQVLSRNIKPIEGRFWAKVDKTVGQGPQGDCWCWTGGRSGLYGTFGTKNNNILAHRFSWALKNGPIPEGLLVLHRCDNPPCVNPEHLFLGTYQDNMTDMMQKGRHRIAPVSGERSGTAKLTWEKVRAIRERYANGEIRKQLAREYGVDFKTLNKVVTRETWKD